jgi:hypothetical protein
MSALIPWLIETFGQLGGALVLIVLLLVLYEVARYAFWTIVALALAWYVGVDLGTIRRERRRHD